MFFWLNYNRSNISFPHQTIGLRDPKPLEPLLFSEKMARSFMAPSVVCFRWSHVESAFDEFNFLILRKKSEKNLQYDFQVLDDVAELQLLVGPGLPSETHSNAKIHLAILPCRLPTSSRFLSIYLLSRRDGCYERLGSSAIVEVKLEDCDFPLLTLQTIHISIPEFDVTDEDRNSLHSLRIKYIHKARFYLDTESLHKCGYAQIDYYSDSVSRIEQKGNNKMLVEGRAGKSFSIAIKFASQTHAVVLAIRYFIINRGDKFAHEYSLRASILPVPFNSEFSQIVPSDYFDRMADILPRGALFHDNFQLFMIRYHTLPSSGGGKYYSANPTIYITVSIRNRIRYEIIDERPGEN